jgi:hypothetical protein
VRDPRVDRGDGMPDDALARGPASFYVASWTVGFPGLSFGPTLGPFLLASLCGVAASIWQAFRHFPRVPAARQSVLNRALA